MVDAGTFRADLYFRIAQVSIGLPALAELPDRRGVAEYLWQAHEAGHGKLPDVVLDRLEAYDWPGNLRELANTLLATAALAGKGHRVGLADLPNHIQPALRSNAPLNMHGELGELTEAAMRRAVDLNRGNLSAAARALGIDRSTLYRRLVWAGKAN